MQKYKLKRKPTNTKIQTKPLKTHNTNLTLTKYKF